MAKKETSVRFANRRASRVYGAGKKRELVAQNCIAIETD